MAPRYSVLVDLPIGDRIKHSLSNHRSESLSGGLILSPAVDVTKLRVWGRQGRTSEKNNEIASVFSAIIDYCSIPNHVVLSVPLRHLCHGWSCSRLEHHRASLRCPHHHRRPLG